jgi:hypothetical protein
MPQLVYRLPAKDTARLKAAAEQTGMAVSDLLGAALDAAVDELVADPFALGNRREADLCRLPRAYASGDLLEWASQLANHGERRRPRWPERRATTGA